MPTIFERLDSLLNAKAHYAIDQAEDPLVMLAQLMRDLDDATRAARREVVQAVAAERQLRNALDGARNNAQACLAMARGLLEAGDEEGARQCAERHVEAEAAVRELESEVKRATERAARLKTRFADLLRKREACARRKITLVARQKAARASRRISAAGARPSASIHVNERMEAVAERVAEVEALASAELDVSDWEAPPDNDFEQRARTARADQVMAELRVTIGQNRNARGGDNHE